MEESMDIFPFVDFEKNQEIKNIFQNKHSEKMHFVLCGLYTDYKLEIQLIKFIEFCGGEAVNNINKKTSHSAIMVKNDAVTWPPAYLGDVFKIQYFTDCFKQKKRLNISEYRCNSKSSFIEDFDFMQIVYYKKFRWEKIPKQFLISTGTKEDTNSSFSGDSLSEEEHEQSNQNAVQIFSLAKAKDREPTANKNSRASYVRKEQESIVKFIVKYKAYDRVKGNELWKKMEEKGVCKIRSWQSMKEHFKKKILPEIRHFTFLKESEIREFELI